MLRDERPCTLEVTGALVLRALERFDRALADGRAGAEIEALESELPRSAFQAVVHERFRKRVRLRDDAAIIRSAGAVTFDTRLVPATDAPGGKIIPAGALLEVSDEWDGELWTHWDGFFLVVPVALVDPADR